MKTTFSPSSRGSAILFVLVIMAVGGVVLAAWIQLLSNRVLYVEALQAGINRRITLENSRALAVQYVRQNVLPGSHSTVVSAALDDNWGAFTIAAPSDGVPLIPLNSIDLPAGNNPFSPGGDGGYTVDLPVTLSDGVNDQTWIFQARSRSPIFSYDLYTAQRPTINTGSSVNVSVGLHVSQSATLWVPNSPNSYGLTVQHFFTPTVTLPGVSLLDGGGDTVLMSNFAFLPVTSGNSGSDWGYNGTISSVAPGGAINSLANRVLSSPHTYVDPLLISSVNGVTSDGAGNVNIDLLDPSMMHVFIAGNAVTIRLQGHAAGNWATADNLPALLIVYVQTGSTATHDLATIELQNQNNRRLYLGVQKNTGTSVNFSATTSGSPLQWRLGATLENTPAQITLASGALQLQGGIRSDQAINISNGTVSLVRETDPKLLERHADRVAWLESYRQ